MGARVDVDSEANSSSSSIHPQNNHSTPSTMTVSKTSSPPPRRPSLRNSFSLIDMVPDLDKITIDELDISDRTEEMVNLCATTSNARDEEKCDDPPDRRLGRRASHPLKSSLKSTSTLSTMATKLDASSTSTIMDESSASRRSAARQQRSVSFSNLEIRSYSVTLGTTPTFNGPPIALDWNYDPSETEKFDVDAYEHYRDTRRTRSELVIPPSHREYCLMQSGFSRSQIKLAMDEAKTAAKEREKTIKSLNRARILSLDGMLGKPKFLSRVGSRRRSSAEV